MERARWWLSKDIEPAQLQREALVGKCLRTTYASFDQEPLPDELTRLMLHLSRDTVEDEF